jgi:hypothetical protein
MGARHTFHRNQLGGCYYYFSGGPFEVPSLYMWTISDYPLERILDHYKAAVAAQEA